MTVLEKPRSLAADKIPVIDVDFHPMPRQQDANVLRHLSPKWQTPADVLDVRAALYNDRTGNVMYKPGGTIADALARIQNKSYVLPAIQREFVWKPEQIERLFDSLMQGYPFGTFLFWKVEPSTSGKFKIYGISDCWRRGLQAVNFAEIDTGGSADWTAFVNDARR